MSLIDFKNVSFSYEKEESLLKNLSFSIEQGENLVIFGNNGSGKTTLSYLMTALLKPAEGKIFIKGQDTADKKNIRSIRNIIGYVFQNPDSQIIGTTVERELAFGLQNLQIPFEEIKEKVEDYLEKFDLKKYKQKNPYELSGGEKHRLAIASILITEPEVIIFDEPTTGLDKLSRKELWDFIGFLRKNYSLTNIIISHNFYVLPFVERVIFLDQGKIVFDGAKDEFLNNSEISQLLYLPKWYELQNEYYPDLRNNLDIEIFINKVANEFEKKY